MANRSSIQLRELPRFETTRALARRYSSMDPTGVEAYLSIVVTGNAVARTIETYLAQHDIAPGRFGVLMYLLREKGRNALPSEIADWLGVTRATMTGLLDGLERDRLVRRAAHPGDRRMTLVALTEQGQACLDRLLPDYFRMTATMVAGLGEADRRALVRLLGKVRDAVARAGAG
ncbi:MAG: MarR family transcriptional regulator [bacterium]